MEVQLVEIAHRGERGDGHQAPVALAQFGALPHLVEQHLVGVVHQAGREIAIRGTHL